MISRYFVCCESNVIGSEALRSFLTNASCCLQRSHTHRLECHSQLERPEGSDAGECGSFSQVTNPLRNAFSALAASGQISMLIKVGPEFGVLPQMPIVRIVDRPSSRLLVDKDAHSRQKSLKRVSDRSVHRTVRWMLLWPSQSCSARVLRQSESRSDSNSNPPPYVGFRRRML